ncbi:gfo/Idh/MocA family oxidoreductase [Pseudoclavibacter sp. AY1F1]|uniref:Gfo/Idh/MocA family protein n=1 Tax=Pseudoclavibacter sp. AY1F1 TaxID=2080583 RepID=UPI000CE832B8|nr:Gfo/Idh/MocA family oxidoreductase [Pseudoclavibacter sp. AY1F1]PPF42904.1 gfo/Idh/MocA family oxidoreductase [Pseudoclavibacter sp. AY1F1]
MQKTRWAILGPGAIAESFAKWLPSSEHGELRAVASRDPERAAVFATRYGAEISGTYAEILARDDVDAVYVATVHTTHADLAVAALEAGKAVLCEKPLAPSAAETERVLAAAERAGLPVVEAYKHRFSPLARAIDRRLQWGQVTLPLQVRTQFGFEAGSRDGRLFDPELAGGAIFDVGGYPVSFAVAVAASAGVALEHLNLEAAHGRVGGATGHVEGGVDVYSTAWLGAEGFTAYVDCSIDTQLSKRADIVGDGGWITLESAFGERDLSPTTLDHFHDGRRTTIEVAQVHPFAAEADAVSRALRDGRLESRAMPWEQTRTVARLLDAWHATVMAGVR